MDSTQSPVYVSLPEWPVRPLQQLTNPESTWLVGGTVRDLLLQRPLHDWDFVTLENGVELARKAANLFQGAFYILDHERKTGRAVVYPPDVLAPITLDFATMRAADLRGDLLKRDFTINSMAMTLSGQLLDPLDCVQDLNNKTIRQTTSHCFAQDAVRLLRAIRQAYLLNYAIDSETYAAITQHAYLITTVSPERIITEMCALLDIPQSSLGMHIMYQTGILQHIIPEFRTLQESKDGVWMDTMAAFQTIDVVMEYLEHGLLDQPVLESFAENKRLNMTLSVLESFRTQLSAYLQEQINAGITRSILLKWAILLQPFALGVVQQRMTALRMPKKSINSLIRHLQACQFTLQHQESMSRKRVYHFYRLAEGDGPGAAILGMVLELFRKDESSSEEDGILVQNTKQLLYTFFAEEKELLSPVPLLRGDELVKLGCKHGPEIGSVMNRLLEAQITGEVTSRDAAMTFVKNLLDTNLDLNGAAT